MLKGMLLLVAVGLSGFGFKASAQENPFQPNQKGNFYIYWGWNRAHYSHSDIHFKGTDYDFTLDNVVARDRQSPFSSKIYLNLGNLTIPQTNLRFGYYFKDKYQLSLGVDHMKYVMVNEQTVNMDGTIANSGTAYDGVYNDQDFKVARDFLLFEHTDGLNYLNAEIRRADVLWSSKHIWLTSQFGAGLGAMMPKTNATLLSNARHDEFHLAGYGLGIVGGLNINFFKYAFLQFEWKGGFIHMPDIRTTQFKADKASQAFFFSQYNFSIGVNYPFGKKNK